MAIYQENFPGPNAPSVIQTPAPIPVIGDVAEQLLAKLLYLASGGRGFVVKSAEAEPPYNQLTTTERCFAFVVMSATARMVNVEGDSDCGFFVDGINDQDLICGTYPGMRLKNALVVDGTVGFYLL